MVTDAMERFWTTMLAILNMLASIWGPSLSIPACAIELRVYEGTCNSETPPTAMATLYADDTCRPAGSDDTVSSLLPGNYVAECTSDGMLVMKQSGCSSSSCDADDEEDAHCNQEGSSIASTLYSKLSPAFPLQDQDSDYSCFGIADAASGTIINFVLFGDCSLPGCVVDGETL